MTSTINHRPPAFDGTENYQPSYLSLSIQEKLIFCQIVSEDFDCVEKMQSLYEFPCGFYRAAKTDNYFCQFFKVLPIEFWPVENFAVSLEKFLVRSGVASRDALSQRFSYQGKEYFYCQMPFMQFEEIKGECEEAEVLGGYLRSVHRALERFPKQEVVAQNWLSRKRKYLKSLGEIQAIQGATTLPDFIAPADIQLINDNLSLLAFDNKNCQVVHGDLSPGNILCEVTSGLDKKYPFMIIDYEISYFSYFPKEFDVAMLLQRLYLQPKGMDRGIPLVTAFLNGYGGLNVNLMEAMRAVSLRSMLILLDRAHCQKEVKRSEWEKFINLFAQVDHYESKLLKAGIC